MRRNHETGFTLIEMCVLLVVMGAVIGTAIVGTSRMIRSNRLAGAANTLVGDLSYARMLATTEGKNFEMRFQSDGYSVVRVAPLGTILSRSCPSGVTCASTGTATFYAWGLTAPVTITFTSAIGSKVLQLAANGSITR
jgi:type II secretory pathway pseudopilin PulG